MTEDDWIEQTMARGRDLVARMRPGMMIEDADGTVRPVTMVEANTINTVSRMIARLENTEAAKAGDASDEASV